MSGACTVNNAGDAPQQEQHQHDGCLAALVVRQTADEDDVDDERHGDDESVTQLDFVTTEITAHGYGFN